MTASSFPRTCRTIIRFFSASLLLAGTLAMAAESSTFTAIQLQPRADAHGGQLTLLTPPPEKLKVYTGKLLLFKPAPAKTTLSINLPVPADGYYHIACNFVYGPWRNGRYGMYSAFADGVGLKNAPHYMHGWYGANPDVPYQIGIKELGTIFLRAPDVELTFVRDTKADGDLFGLELVRLEPVDPPNTTATERIARVPDRPVATPIAATLPACRIEAEQPLTWVTPVPALKKPVTLDGDLADWDFSKPLITINAASITGRGYGAPAPENDTDLSAVAQLAWDKTNLFFAARMTDDMLAKTEPGKWSSFWSHDGMVFATHTPPWIAKREGKSSVVKDFSAGFNCYSAGGSPRVFPAGTRYFVKPVTGGYTIEAAIPFAALGFSPQADDRFPFMLIAVDMDPGKPAGLQFKQYLWNTRGGDSLRWGEMRLVTDKGWSADLIPEKETYGAGQSLRYVGMIDVFKSGLTLKSVQIVNLQSGQVVCSEPVRLKLTANRRLRLHGELHLPQLKEGQYDLRLQVE
ncbi:MAG TPA: sugar-binding protein [Armatimonadota bacterium]